MRPSRRQTQPFTRHSAGRPTVTSLLVALGVGAYVSQEVITFMLSDQDGGRMLWQWLALDGAGIRDGQYWKFFTHPFLHTNVLHIPLHLIVNMLLLYFAGCEVEPIVGRWNFLGIFGVGALLGGIAQSLVLPAETIVGMSAGVVAVLIAFCTILPELEVTLMLFFLVPVRLRAKHLAVALVLMNVALCYTHTLPAIGPVAMLAATVAGWLYVKQLGYGNPLAIQRYIFEKRERAARLERMSPEQFISGEIDPILDKISREGMHSLTRAERKILALGKDKIAAKPARK